MAKRFLNVGFTDIIHLIRYRFLLFAGLLPYCLGAVVAYYEAFAFDLQLFLTGLAGIFFTLMGVEAFNEYFDWILGTDRVFLLNPKPITKKKFYIGVSAFAVALIFAIYLTLQVGVGVAIFAVFGFTAAVGYLGPPVKFTYRGFGEIIIALAYGPAMVLGSYYLQTGETAFLPLIASFVPALFLFLIAVTNEIPDFIQDRLVGKKNVCVRLGTEKTVKLYGILSIFFFVGFIACLIIGKFPKTAWLILLTAPFHYFYYRKAVNSCNTPRSFLPVVRGTIILYVITMAIFMIGFLFSGI